MVTPGGVVGKGLLMALRKALFLHPFFLPQLGEIRKQQDASEALFAILDSIYETRYKDTGLNVHLGLETIDVTKEIICQACHQGRTVPNRGVVTMLLLPMDEEKVVDGVSLEDLINDSMDHTDGEISACPTCDGQNTHRHKETLADLPRKLPICLSHFSTEWDRESSDAVLRKSHKKVTLSERIDLEQKVGNGPGAVKSYGVKELIIHRGDSLSSGHYLCIKMVSF